MMIAIPLGLFFGFALYYVGATENKNIIDMLTFRNLSLAKIILGAIGFASLCVGILNLFHFIPPSHFDIKEMNIGVILGGAIFGIGFGLIGSCPGTAVAALFTSFKRAVWIVLGGLAGAFCFSLCYPMFSHFHLVQGWNFGKLTLFNLFGNQPSIFSIGFGGLIIFGGILIGISLLIPEKINQKNQSK